MYLEIHQVFKNLDSHTHLAKLSVEVCLTVWVSGCQDLCIQPKRLQSIRCTRMLYGCIG